MNRYLAFASLFLVSIVSSHAADTLPATIDRPDVKVGDSWTYNTIDNWKHVRTNTFTHTVTKVDNESITADATTNGSAITLKFTREWNPTERPDRIYKPNYPMLSFPLQVGKTWDASYEIAWKAGNRKIATSMKGTVVGMEKITTPAGEFNTFKIVLDGTYTGSSVMNTWSGHVSTTIWYSPDVKKTVKVDYDDGYTKESTELVSFKLN